MTHTVHAIIQAHMSSSRLPGKVLKPICGKPALYRMIERVRQSKYITKVIVATSSEKCDDVLEEFCKEMGGVECFRGSDNDVLMRYVGASQAYPSDYVVRLTSDCPLIDAKEIDKVIEAFFKKNVRYGRFDSEHYANGMDAEIFTTDLLMETAEKATERYEHEHVTPYMYMKNTSVMNLFQREDGSKYRLTLDTPEDYAHICAIYGALYNEKNDFTLDDIIRFLDENPAIYWLNADIRQKSATEVKED